MRRADNKEDEIMRLSGGFEGWGKAMISGFLLKMVRDLKGIIL